MALLRPDYIFSFMGAKGSGKDTAAEMLRSVFEERVFNVYHVSFADKLKEVIWDLYGYKIMREEYIFGSKNEKETPIPRWDIPQETIDRYELSETQWTGRLLLQLFGTEIGRGIDDEVWVNAVYKTISNYPSDSIITLADCRFQDEYDFLETYKAKHTTVVHVLVDRESAKDNQFSNHITEQFYKTVKPDVVLENNGTLDDLDDKIKDLIKSYGF